MILQDYNLPAKLTFRKKTTNEGKTFFSVSVEAIDNGGAVITLDITMCADAQKLLPVFDEALKNRGAI